MVLSGPAWTADCEDQMKACEGYLVRIFNEVSLHVQGNGNRGFDLPGWVSVMIDYLLAQCAFEV